VAEAMEATARRVSGGTFLIEDLRPHEIFTPEDFSPEQKQIAQMASDFAEAKILTQVAAIEAKDFEVSKQLMRDLGALGLLAVDVPEEYGGLELDKVTSTVIAQCLSPVSSFSATIVGHTGIGMLPLIWYGTLAQKEAYLEKLASGDWIAAYALSESSAGSDAMNIRTRATLSEDGEFYMLNGEKMWITNAGFASIFTIFVPAGTEGLTVAAEEHKLGIRGSSTCALVLDNCKVPVENVLGTAGKGHHIAFNVLNVGRYKLAANSVGSAKQAFLDGIRYASNRIAFGKPITQFGLIQKKFADSAAKLFALESTLYRVVGAIDIALAELDKDSPTYTQDVQKCIEEFAAECSMLKFIGSEILVSVVDEMLQVHGGYGYVEEFPAERQYRDAKINMIFEGTNEINRLITTGWLMKRALSGTLPLLPAIRNVMGEVMSGPIMRQNYEGPLAEERALLANMKKISLFCSGLAMQRFGDKLSDQQEVMGALAEIFAEVLMLESAMLRAEKMASLKPISLKLAMYYAGHSFRLLVASAERVLGTGAAEDDFRKQMVIFHGLIKHEARNAVEIGREISTAMVEAGRYVV
jgi:alkylation response protein AidB-like acyl-CoA dehydrogenase